MNWAVVLMLVLCIVLIHNIDRVIGWVAGLRGPTAPHELLAASAGVMDGPAEAALARAGAVGDHATAAAVLAENLLQGRAPLAAPATAAAAHHFRAALARSTGLPADDTLRRADAFAGRLEVGDDEPIPAWALDLTDAVADAQDRRAEAARAATTTPLATLAALTVHTSDPQNPHDSEVNDQLRMTAARLFADDLPGATAVYDQIAARTADRAARRALDHIYATNELISSVGRREVDLLRAVWARADLPANAAHADDIRAAVVAALADMAAENGWGERPMVCASGRAARLVGALSSIDHDPAVGNLRTKEMVKNYVLESAAGLWLAYLAEMARSDDPVIRAVAADYEGTGDAPPSPEALARFRAELRARADRMLAENNVQKYPDIVHDVYVGLDLE